MTHITISHSKVLILPDPLLSAGDATGADPIGQLIHGVAVAGSRLLGVCGCHWHHDRLGVFGNGFLGFSVLPKKQNVCQPLFPKHVVIVEPRVLQVL